MKSSDKKPKLAIKILSWFCKSELLEALMGDLEEQFERSTSPNWRRNLNYWFQVINILRPFALKRIAILNSNFIGISKFNLKVTFRSIRKDLTFSLINIFGLGIGLFSSLLIIEYVSHQKSFDTFHPNVSSSFRITHTTQLEDNSIEKIATFSRVAEELSTNFPAVSKVCRILPVKGNVVVEWEESRFREEHILGVDSSFFTIFRFPFVLGSPEQALSDPRSIVITERIAKKFFKQDENPIGQEIILDGAFGLYSSEGYQDRLVFKVMGVIEDLPTNTHLKFDYLVSFSLYPNLETELNNWGESFYTYIQLNDPLKVESITKGLSSITKKYRPNQGTVLGLQPLRDIHLTSNRIGEFKSSGSEKSLWLLIAVAVTLLFIAATNYINFATAKTIIKQKEIGIRKVFWAKKWQLFFQLMTDAFVINGLSLVFAFILIPILHPFINDFVEFDILDQIFTTKFFLKCIAVLMITTILSGIYPALYITKMNLNEVIQSRSNSGRKGIAARKFLIGLQFAISLLVIVFSTIVYSQMNYIDQKELGLNIKKTIVLSGPSVGVENDSLYKSSIIFLKNEMNKISDIDQITLANFIPGKPIMGQASGYVRKLGAPERGADSYYFSQVDHDWISTMEVPLVAGRAFSLSSPSDYNSIVINREASNRLGFSSPHEAIGKKVNYRMQSTPTIVGVIDNFHQSSLKRSYDPIILEVRDAPNKYVYLRVSESAYFSTIEKIESIWTNTFPGNPFHFFFLDDAYKLQYHEENKFMKAFSFFSIIAVLIAVLGIFGLTYFTANYSLKEICIRKTLGANFANINWVIFKRLGLNMIWACLISIPIVYFLSENWLNNYAFRITIRWWMIMTPTALLFFLAITVITGQMIRSYKVNPASRLR